MHSAWIAYVPVGVFGYEFCPLPKFEKLQASQEGLCSIELLSYVILNTFDIIVVFINKNKLPAVQCLFSQTCS